jgi:LysM repeat protein
VKIYVVQPGDTVAKILERFRLTEEELASLNAGNHYRKIRVGERIVIFEQTSSAGENGWK